MAETIISPGVFTRENDISFIQPASVEAGAAFVGPTVKGPVEIPTVITSYNAYVRKFGETFESGSSKQEYLTSLAVKSYFQQGGNTALITRVVSASSNWTSATSTNITNQSTPAGANTATGSGNIGSAFVDGQEARFTDASSTVYRFIASGNPIPSDDVDGNVFFFSTGSSAAGTAQNLRDEFNNAAALQSIVSASVSASVLILSGSSAGTLPNGSTFVTSSATDATTFQTSFITVGGGTTTSTAGSNPFKIQTLGKGEIFNGSLSAGSAGGENSDGSLSSGSADNIRWEISNVSVKKGTFTLSVRRGDDNNKNKIVLETFNNLSLDPNSDNFISKVIGDQLLSKESDSDGVIYLGVSGSYPNKSNFIRVSEVNSPTYNYFLNDGVSVGTDAGGTSYSASLPVNSSGSFFGAVGTNIVPGANYFGSIQGTTEQSQGLVNSDYNDAITLLENKDEFNFNIISVPGLTQAAHGSTIAKVVSLAETRGDAIAVVDLVGYGNTLATAVSEANEINSSYAAAYWPWVQVGSATGKNEFVPPSTVIPGVYAFTDGASAPWFAPAGLVRGGIPNVIQAERKLTKADRDNLYDGNVNPIATFPGQGIAAFGQKTLQKKSSALDRVNVRRLLIALKKFFGDQARNLVFEQNTIATRNRFLSIVNPYLESVVQQQGLYSFRVVMDDSNNTSDVIDRNQLVGQVFIQPAKTAEFIVLDFTIEPTGATFDA